MSFVGRRTLRPLTSRSIPALALVVIAAGLVGAKPAEKPRAAPNPAIRWIEVPAGTLVRGTGSTACRVAVDSFLMSATEITFAQYDAYCEATGAPKPADEGWGRGAFPVMHVSYDDALGFCRWLSKATGTVVRLPTEAEWVFAAQGGSRTRGYVHSGSDDAGEVSWNERNSGGRTHPVGTKKPNELGLFDMSGSLWEWCADLRGTGPRECASCADDGAGPPLYGDSYDNPGSRAGFRGCVRLERGSRHENIGFRIARSK